MRKKEKNGQCSESICGPERHKRRFCQQLTRLSDWEERSRQAWTYEYEGETPRGVHGVITDGALPVGQAQGGVWAEEAPHRQGLQHFCN